MKKIVSLLLVTIMLFSGLVSVSFAAPANECLKFSDKQVYSYFDRFTTMADNTVISFDLSMSTVGDDGPKLNINTDSIIFTLSTINVHGKTTSYNWGADEKTHWRHVDITYSGSTCTVSLDGTVVATGTGSCRTNGIIFIGWPGYMLVDNLKVISAGATVLDLVFEDEITYLNYKNSESSAVRTTVPSGSYCDYTEVVVPENVGYIFDSAENCEKLTVESGETYLQGDIDGDGEISIKDSRLLKKVLAGLEDFEDYPHSDIDGDEEPSIKDSRLLKKYLAGLDEPEYISTGSSASAEFEATMMSAKLTAGEAVVEGIDATLTMDEIDHEDYPFAVVTYMTPDSESDRNSTAAAQSGFGAWGNFVTYDLTTDGKFHSQIVDLSEVSTWNGDAATLRFFVAANEGDDLYVDSIIFCANRTKANAVVTARENAKASYGITDKPDVPVVPVGGAIGAYDDKGNYQIIFDNASKVNSKVSLGNNSTFKYNDEEGALQATTTNQSDPSIYIDLTDENISANQFKYIIYTYRSPGSNQRDGARGNMYYVCGSINEPTGGYETDAFDVAESYAYNTVIIDLTKNSNWSGSIKGLRIDYFTDAPKGDTCFIDSIIFATTSGNAKNVSNERIIARNGEPEQSDSGNPAADAWNLYWGYYKNANGNEFIAGDNTDLRMYFRYGSESKLTARSLGDRMARAITEATGKDVTCEVYQGFVGLKDRWNDSSPTYEVMYTIRCEGVAYVAVVKTCIIKDSSYRDELDGTSADPEVGYQNTSTWTSEGITITDSSPLKNYTTYLAAHSNHENKLVRTPYGTFAIYVVSGDEDTWGEVGGSRFSILRIYDDGTYKVLGTYDGTFHTTKPNIYYAADGLVYAISADVQFGSNNSEVGSVFIGYFDPSKPNSDGSYNITASRKNMSYPGGECPGGYGYSMPILDDTQGKFYLTYAGGRDSLGCYFTWFTYNYRTHQFEQGSSSVAWDHYRHCYTFGYPDGNGGFYIIAERTCLLECVGLKGIVYNVDYTWDQLTMFHFPSATSGQVTSQVVVDPDYTQVARELYPTISNNTCGDAYIADNGMLHILYNIKMHGRDHHDTRYSIMGHSIYDMTGTGKATKLFDEPIAFGTPSNDVNAKFYEATDHTLYILCMPHDKAARCELWKQTDSTGEYYSMVACRNFSCGGEMGTGHILSGKRSGSIRDNVIDVIFPVNDRGQYYFFRVNLNK